ncbi:MAG: hypothetical protein HY040_12685 [Planctomycetes bacterium]|nr:hypothetical protein [Planctomycetota bacterium]
MNPKTPKRLRAKRRPPLTIDMILAWADDHFERKKRWPRSDAGPVRLNLNEKWSAIDQALLLGLRGLPKGSSLARLLAKFRGVRNRKALPPLKVGQILKWADEFKSRTGRWPTQKAGAISDRGWYSWSLVDAALLLGRGGLPGGSSLARLLEAHRGRPHQQSIPRLLHRLILVWADAHRARTGRWPTVTSGEIHELKDKTWKTVDTYLRHGARGLPGGTSLAQLLEKHRGVHNRLTRALLPKAQILAWADAHFRRHGSWPHARSGTISSSGGETWGGIESALQTGRRGHPGGITLARFLERERNAPIRKRPPPLTEGEILAWADAFHANTGRWPKYLSGPVAENERTTWACVEQALRSGQRGLPGGSSLARLLASRRGVPNRLGKPKLSVREILRWMKSHQRRTGKWPGESSGPIPEAPGDTWFIVNNALYMGCRGMAGGSSLARLVVKHFAD